MPIYEFVCGKCGEEFEELIFSSGENPVCPKCGSSAAQKKMSSPARRSSKSQSGGDFSPAPAAGGCGGCSGGNCGSCGR